jgi:ABC-type multidrug transport system ATPase subunit
MRFSLDTIRFRYRNSPAPALDGITVAFDSGEIVGLAGANGSGKTTLLRILLRQLVDYAGEYRIDGSPVTDIAGNVISRYGIGYAPDEPMLDDALTGYEILELVGRMRGADHDGLAHDVELFVKHLRIGDWLRTQPCSEYSAGMRRKVSIALAFVGPVRFAILDEPVNGLDPLSVVGLRELMAHKRDAGVGSLVSSHILDFIDKSAHQVILLKTGTPLFAGNLDTLRLRRNGESLEHIYYTMFEERDSQ